MNIVVNALMGRMLTGMHWEHLYLYEFSQYKWLECNDWKRMRNRKTVEWLSIDRGYRKCHPSQSSRTVLRTRKKTVVNPVSSNGIFSWDMGSRSTTYEFLSQSNENYGLGMDKVHQTIWSGNLIEFNGGLKPKPLLNNKDKAFEVTTNKAELAI